VSWRPAAIAVLAAASCGASPSAGTPLASTASLVARLGRTGHGEARLVQTVVAQGETLRADRGRVALEPPDRLRLDFAASGERITMRGDGGEWLQPAMKQLLILRPEQAQTVVATWRAFLDGGAGAYRERALGPRRYRLIPIADANADADSLEVELGPDRLPRRVQIWVQDQRWWLTLSSWSFGRPKGPTAFTVRAPAGYAVLEWP